MRRMMGNEVEYFWCRRPENEFPPEPIVRPDEFGGGRRLHVVCTQTGLPSRKQQAIVREWCNALPRLSEVRWLWFSSRVPQSLFEAACRVPELEGLYVKWSGIDDLSAIEGSATLRSFHWGQSSRVASIEPLSRLRQLRWLGLELLSKIRTLDPIGALMRLEGLSLEGSISTTWRVQSLAPIGHLTGLRYLSIANLRADDASLGALFSLRFLVTFRHAAWWNAGEVAEIRRRNPELAG